MAQERAASGRDEKLAEPIAKGQHVFTCGHSFHVWVPGIVADLAKKAGIEGHKQLGVSSIGGSRVIRHWDIPADKKAKETLATGKVEVLTLSPIFLPDPGIENFTTLASNTTRTCVSSSNRSGSAGTLTSRPRSGPRRSITMRSLAKNFVSVTPSIFKKWTSTSAS
jgi:hypothetical protein